MRSTLIRAAIVAGGVGVAGTAAAALNAGIWLNYVAAPGSPYAPWGETIRRVAWMLGLAVAVGTASAITATSSGNFLARVSWTCRAIAGLVVGSASFWLLRSATRSWIYSDPWLLAAISVGLATCTALLRWILSGCGRAVWRRAALWGIVVLLGWPVAVFWARWSVFNDSRGFGGLGVVSSLQGPLELQMPAELTPELLGGVVAGLLLGIGLSAALKGRLRYGALAGAAVGLIVSATCYVVQTRSLAAALRAAYAEGVTFRSTFWLGAGGAWILAALAGLTVVAWERGAIRAVRYVAAGLSVAMLIAYFAISASRIESAFAGHDLLARALELPGDGSRVYLHLAADGTWRRSIERKAASEVADLCNRIIERFPRSSYRPAALYLKATVQFENWDFRGAASTLERLRGDYTFVSGANGILLFLSYMALGDNQKAASTARGDWVLAQWQESEGAQIVATMCERLGRFRGASGAYSLYADYVRARMGPGAAARALALSAAFADKSSAKSPVACVSGRVLVGDKRARGVIVALVQPRLDAVSLAESQQFVGARTLPMWRGVSAVTDDGGSFAVDPVVAGDYELVFGFDEASVPRGYTLRAPRNGVSVRRGSVDLGVIRFVPRLKLIDPKPGSCLDDRLLLRWSRYPGASSYSVSVLSTPDPGGALGRAETCWIRTGVRGTCTQVTEDGFRRAGGSSVEVAQKRLLPRRIYLCWVHAYDDAGRFLASSEDYYRTGLDSFRVSSRVPGRLSDKLPRSGR